MFLPFRCDCHAIAAMERGRLLRFYVAELNLAAWDPDDPRNANLIVHPRAKQLQPIFQASKPKLYLQIKMYRIIHVLLLSIYKTALFRTRRAFATSAATA